MPVRVHPHPPIRVINVNVSQLTIYSLSLLVMLGIGATQAAIPKQPNANSQALQKAQGMVRQLSEEKAALEAEKIDLQEQLQKLAVQVKQLAPLQVDVQRYQADAETLRGHNSNLSAQVAAGQQKQQVLQQKLREIVAQAKQIQADNQLLVSAVKEREQWIGQCRDKNPSLVAANRELLGKYQDRGFWDRVAEWEPFTGIANVDKQNAVENYQFKLEDLQVTEFGDDRK
jgi:predicted  nucleic acid-binding Zn-ribbon protein